jgi:twinkle protein
VSAAKQLRREGYGQKTEHKAVDLDIVTTTQTLKASDFKDRIYNFYTKKFEMGEIIGYPMLDNHLRLDKGQLNVVTGIPSHGKSTFVDFWSMMLAIKRGWQFVVFSPENYPLEIHYNKLAEIYHGFKLFGRERFIIDEAIDFIDQHYSFVDATEEEVTLDNLIECVNGKTCHSFILDPWNELEITKPKDMNESDFTGSCLRKLRKFARKKNICIIIVAHPAKMYRQKETGKYPIPHMYDISGSANFYNKCDNGIVVYRNFDTNITEVHIKKVKYRNYGKTGQINFRYNEDSNSYEEIETVTEIGAWYG